MRTTIQNWLGSLAALALAGVVVTGCTSEASPIDASTETVQGRQDASLEDAFSESLLELRVRSALLDDLELDALGLGVAVDGSAVHLAGEVEKPESRTLAEEIAQAVDGVGAVTNEITVLEAQASESETDAATLDALAEALTHELADAKLETRVKLKLVEELGRVAFDVDVDATDGTVSLRGEIPDDERRRVAVTLTRDLDGVDRVYDLLTVAS